MTHRIFTIGLATLTLSSCATATGGFREGLRITSEPAGARAVSTVAAKGSTPAESTFGGLLGCEPTPCAISIPRNAKPVITVSKDGFQTIAFKVTSSRATSASSIRAGSVVAGLPPGSHVMAGESSLLKRIGTDGYHLAPNPVIVYLAPNKAVTTP